MIRLSALIALAVIGLTASAASAQSLLGSAETFAVLGGSTVTNTGLTVVTGDVGVSPGTSITGFPPGVIVGGALHAGDLAAAQAHADAFMASARLKAMTCLPANNLSGQDLGTLTLPPGVYCFNTSAQLTGTLFLTGNGPWVFQIGTTLTTGTAAAVVVAGAGTGCTANVFWQIGTSATLGVGTQFIGTIIASASITVVSGTSVSGRALAIDGAVTMDTNAVSVCAAGAGNPGDDGDGDEDDDGDHHHGDHDGHHHHGHHHHHGDKDHKDHKDGKDGKDKDHKDDGGKNRK